MKIINPADESVIREIEEDTDEAIRAKFQKAKKAQPAWANLRLSDRVDILRRYAKILERDVEKLAPTLTAEMGKPITQSKKEILATPERVEFFAANVARAIADQVVAESPAVKEVIRFEPLGVVLNISAWNYPYFVSNNVVVPALLTGNAVLFKPSEFTLLSGLEMCERLYEAGVPRDVLIPLVGSGRVGAQALQLDLGGVFFTGSSATGAKISQALGGRTVKVQLEMGGKDPTYVADDADLDKAVSSLADGAFYNAGQSCCSVERLYVHEQIYNAFVDKFVAEVKTYKVGDPKDSATYLGPLTRPQQLNVLEDQVSDAVKKGAKLLLGGNRRAGKGFFFEPTVLKDVDSTMKVMKDESFGPIIGIQKVHSDEEALHLMNDSEYGLTSGVYTKSQARAEKLISQLNSGSVYWNCCDRVSSALPWTGRKHSGIGSTSSVLGIQAFVQPKALHLKPSI